MFNFFFIGTRIYELDLSGGDDNVLVTLMGGLCLGGGGFWKIYMIEKGTRMVTWSFTNI